MHPRSSRALTSAPLDKQSLAMSHRPVAPAKNGREPSQHRCSGVAPILLEAQEMLLKWEAKDKYVVDTGYVVAFEDTLDYNISVVL